MKTNYSDGEMVEFAKTLAKEYLQHNVPSPETKKMIKENKESLLKFGKEFARYMAKNDMRWQKHEDIQGQILEQTKKTNGRVTKLEGKDINRANVENYEKGRREATIGILKILATIGFLGGGGSAVVSILQFL